MENIYFQYLGGEKSYACDVPCEASELVHFRNRIGTEGIELIFKESIRIVASALRPVASNCVALRRS